MKIQFISFLSVFIAVFSLISCESNSEKMEQSTFKPDTLFVDDSYPEINSEIVLEVMENLQVCTSSDTVNLPPCSNEYFRIFSLSPQTPFDKGFVLEMKAGMFGTPVKQILVVEKGFNKYQIVNQYLGFLIEFRTTENSYNDLLVGYTDPEIGVVGIKHVWNEQHYEPLDVEEINGYYIKPEVKDSINHLFIDNFNAGY